MKTHKLIVSKNTYFNFKADLRSFQADSGLSHLLPFHVPRLEHRQHSPTFLGDFTLDFAVSSYSLSPEDGCDTAAPPAQSSHALYTCLDHSPSSYSR